MAKRKQKKRKNKAQKKQRQMQQARKANISPPVDNVKKEKEEEEEFHGIWDFDPEPYVDSIPSQPPIPILRLSNHNIWASNQRLKVEIVFKYGDTEISVDYKSEDELKLASRQRARQMLEEEKRLLHVLRSCRFLAIDTFGFGYMAFTQKLLPQISTIIEEGWKIESEEKPVRLSTALHCCVKSNIDWLDLQCVIRYDDLTINLANIYSKIKAGENFFQLGDGSFALLPANVTERFSLLFEIAHEQTPQGVLRFRRSQALLIDALLKMHEMTFDVDEAFQNIQASLQKSASDSKVKPPKEFKGKLRHYQQEGLIWLLHLYEAGFGGCLADDMGLGKTIQILALFQYMKVTKKATGPALIVVPLSLLINWQREAEHFTPNLRVVIHHGSERSVKKLKLEKSDLILTTFGTLRNDVLHWESIEFDTCILDEAQAIKNPKSQAAKAVRLIKARHRFVLTGTPIENHLGDLWSLFDFLNPGLLGTGPRFRRLIDNPSITPDSGTLKFISDTIQPFLLRRTKEQVLKDLPEKTETTLYCTMEGRQQELYTAMRDTFRADLLGLVKTQGLGRSKIKVIEALLRLRQCACHPGLIDDKLSEEPSAKLELLFEQLTEIAEEGHKALVFSQFTSFLTFVRNKLDAAKLPYEFLDGKTKNRQERVDHFQTDPNCRVFLISLKAGGLGLNLTAADYVYILDPWWNPAAESQAIDRVHRIGQAKKVFAYRIIVQNTVEEKVLQLQQHKRNLADAILTAEKSVMKKLDLDDLNLLLS